MTEQFNKKLCRLRKSAKLSRRELAEALNVSHDTIQRWERGDREPRYSHLLSLARVFNITLTELFGEEPNKITATTTSEMANTGITVTPNLNGINANLSSVSGNTITISIAVPSAYLASPCAQCPHRQQQGQD